MLTAELSYDPAVSLEIVRAFEMAAIVGTLPNLTLPPDWFNAVATLLMIKAGAADLTSLGFARGRVTLVEAKTRSPQLAIALCLSMEVAARLHAEGRDLAETMAYATDEGQWRPKETMPLEALPCLQAFRQELPGKFTELHSMPLEDLWWIAQPHLVASGLVSASVSYSTVLH